MYNRLYQYLTKNEIPYPKEFGIQTGHSTGHAIVQLVGQILESFEYNKYTLGVFINLSKAFDTVDHSKIFKKHELHGKFSVVNTICICLFPPNSCDCLKPECNFY